MLWPGGPLRWQQIVYAYFVIPLPGQALMAVLLALLASLARRTAQQLQAVPAK